MGRIYNIRAGANLTEEILRIAEKEKLATAKIEAIGAIRQLRLAYYNPRSKKYEEHEYEEFLEVTSILGNITEKAGKPFLHMHGTFGRRDMSVIGGHVVSATVFPLLEVIITPTKNRAFRRFDEKSGLNLIYKTQG